MRMYELWKVPKDGGDPARLEDEAGPILFPRMCDAEEQSREDPDRWDASYCAVRRIGDSLSWTAQSGGESEEGRRPTPLGRVRGEG